MNNTQKHSGTGDNIAGNKIVHNHKEKSVSKWLTGLPLFNPQDMVGRTKELQQLSDLFAQTHRVVLVNGLGGVGKSTLARMYVEQQAKNYDHIAWLGFKDQDSSDMKQMFLSTGLIAGLHLEDIPAEQVFDILVQRLHSLKGKNLLIVDNADNPEAIENHMHYLPSNDNWTILLTSRSKIAHFKELPLDVLSPEDAQTLFLKFYPKANKEPEALHELLKEIGYHTLTVEIMAKTLAESWGLTVAKLLEKVKAKQLADDDLKEAIWIAHRKIYGKQTEHDKARIMGIYENLLVCFELATLTKDEQWMLKQFAVLPPADMDATILLEWLGEETQSKQTSKRLIQQLGSKGWLLQNQQDKKVFKMHPVVKLLALEGLKPRFEDCKKLAEGLTKDITITSSTNSIATKLRWIDYGEELLKVLWDENKIGNIANTLEISKIVADLCTELGHAYEHQGNYAQALNNKTNALEIMMKRLPSKNSDVIISIARYQANLATVYEKQGNYEKARELLEYSLAKGIEHLGSDHPEVAIRQSNLATIYSSLGNYEKARDLLELALTNQLKHFDAEHPTIANRQSILGNIYFRLGNLKKSKELHELALSNAIKYFDTKHPAVAIYQSNLGNVQIALGDYEKAHELMESTLDIHMAIYEPSHPHIAQAQASLAKVYQCLGNYKKALQLLEPALENMIAYFNKKHPNVALFQNSLAHIYFSLDEHAKAAQLWQEAYETSKITLGDSHPQTLAIKECL